jgi:hypothetical protein
MKGKMTFRNCQWRTYGFATEEMVKKGERQKYHLVETDGSKHVPSTTEFNKITQTFWTRNELVGFVSVARVRPRVRSK